MTTRVAVFVGFASLAVACGAPPPRAESPLRASVDEPHLSVEAEVARLNAPTPWGRACGRHVIEAIDRARSLPAAGKTYDHLSPTWRDVTDGSEEIRVHHMFKIVIVSVRITRRASPLDAAFEERAWSPAGTDEGFPRSWSRETRWGKASLYFYYPDAAETLVPLLRPAVDACLAASSTARTERSFELAERIEHGANRMP
jgi:hypothetical protein